MPPPNTQLLAWQGWHLTVRAEWNPVKIDGDYDSGSVLLADLHSARLGLRWKTAAKRGDPQAWANRSLRDEVGKLAADEAKDLALPNGGDWSVSRLYQDPNPPGRDVWVGHSRRSNRVLQIVYHAAQRGTAFSRGVLPTLADTSPDAPHCWAVFDLSLTTPPGTRVQWYRFNAGDLSMGLTSKGTKPITVVRQIGPAGLALARQPLSTWLTHLPASTRRLYQTVRATEATTLNHLPGLQATLRRKRRLWWAWPVPRRQTILAFHDEERDRLIAGQGVDEADLRNLLTTIGR